MMIKTKKRGKRNMNKLGVSLMISYVLLIFITVTLSIGVYIWLKDYAVVDEKTNCKDGTSLIIEKYNIEEDLGDKKITISVKNNGVFNVDGLLITAGNNSQRVPMELIKAENNLEGHYYFEPPLGPGKSKDAEFDISELDLIEIIQLQPYILAENQLTRIYCEDALIKQEILINPSLISGLVSWWNFDGNVLDFGSNENDGTNNGAVYVDGKLNQGLEFDGGDSFEANVGTLSDNMISFWYNTTTIAWTHVVFNSSTAYVNGVVDSNPVPTLVSYTGGNVAIGSGFTGLIDEVAIYNRALSEWEALQLYNSYNLTGII